MEGCKASGRAAASSGRTWLSHHNGLGVQLQMSPTSGGASRTGTQAFTTQSYSTLEAGPGLRSWLCISVESTEG